MQYFLARTLQAKLWNVRVCSTVAARPIVESARSLLLACFPGETVLFTPVREKSCLLIRPGLRGRFQQALRRLANDCNLSSFRDDETRRKEGGESMYHAATLNRFATLGMFSARVCHLSHHHRRGRPKTRIRMG